MRSSAQAEGRIFMHFIIFAILKLPLFFFIESAFSISRRVPEGLNIFSIRGI